MPELFIGGRWCGSVGGGRREVRCPADNTLVGVVDEGTEVDTGAAIAAAREAFDRGSWSGLSVGERGAVLARVADLLVR
ncbi:betaine-aldehyde dehydrogenase, partial [Nocardioides gansuensis]